MTVDEVRSIKERKSLETIGMSVSELNSYYSLGAIEVQKKIDEVRKSNSEIDCSASITDRFVKA